MKTHRITGLKPLGPPPRASSRAVSKSMKSNVAKGTTPEILMKTTLRKAGLKDYVSSPKDVPGRPDIAFPKKKIAIFVHGCFWHRCPYHAPSLPKAHRAFWKRKFERNVIRDRIKKKVLEKAGWKVFVFWECDIRNVPYKLIKKVVNYDRRDHRRPKNQKRE